MKLRDKIILFAASIALLTILITGGLFFFITLKSTDSHIEMHLDSIQTLKEHQLGHFFSHQIKEIEDIDDKDLGYFLNLAGSERAALEPYLRNYFEEKMDHTEFFEIFLMDLEGKIILSSDPVQEGKIKSAKEYFKQGREQPFIHKFYYSLALEEPAVTVARPVVAEGRSVGVLAARVSLTEFSRIMTEDAGLGRTGETYLVNKYNYAVTGLNKLDAAALRTVIRTTAAQNCIAHSEESESFLAYTDYAGDEVIGSYSWLDEHEVCLIVQMDEDEAYDVMNRNLKIMVFAAMIILILVILSAFLITRSIREPLSKLEKGAKKIAEGDTDFKIRIKTNDEISEVAKAFNYMVDQLKKSQEEVLEHDQELELKIEERTSELEKKVEELEKTKLAVMNILEDTDESNKELVKLKDKLSETIRKLRGMDKTKDEFLSITAHELKTPLTSIRGFIELLKMDKVMSNKGMRNKYFDIIIQDTQRLGKLITDILDLSRLDIGSMKFNREHVPISEIFKDLKNLVDLAIKNKNVKPVYEFHKKIPDLFVDRSRLLQVISNLVNNSIKYTEDGFIRVKAELKEKYVHFTVEDTGKGIPKKEHANIFKRFYQVDSSYTRKVGGTGLGLAICKGIVEQMGGKIWVAESIEDKGTVMEFTVPVSKKSSPKK